MIIISMYENFNKSFPLMVYGLSIGNNEPHGRHREEEKVEEDEKNGFIA